MSTLEKIPQNIMKLILDCLTISDYAQLHLVSKKLYMIVHKNSSNWTKEGIKRFLMFQIPRYYVLPDYGQYLNSQRLLTENFFEENQKKMEVYIRGFCKLQYEWVEVLSAFLEDNQSREFTQKIFDVLRDPDLPPLTLRREDFAQFAQTPFQILLSEKIFEESEDQPPDDDIGDDLIEEELDEDGLPPPPSFGMMPPPLDEDFQEEANMDETRKKKTTINELQKHKKQLFAEHLSSIKSARRECLLLAGTCTKLRWRVVLSVRRRRNSGGMKIPCRCSMIQLRPSKLGQSSNPHRTIQTCEKAIAQPRPNSSLVIRTILSR
eukprot:TRINITY_DN3145_c0_g1_i3.p1 TRINITY_DN3145_c0_g1~~TRINITY_DN3145_c0_g1_i3.p1  ORF type:complete len:321 (-),score=35.13 TRINITY_DN3145_c0_g1_i3:39-1001(-)